MCVYMYIYFFFKFFFPLGDQFSPPFLKPRGLSASGMRGISAGYRGDGPGRAALHPTHPHTHTLHEWVPPTRGAWGLLHAPCVALGINFWFIPVGAFHASGGDVGFDVKWWCGRVFFPLSPLLPLPHFFSHPGQLLPTLVEQRGKPRTRFLWPCHYPGLVLQVLSGFAGRTRTPTPGGAALQK